MKKLTLLLVVTILSCSNDHDIDNGNIMPNSIQLIVIDSKGNALINKNTLTNLIYFYNKNKEKTYSNSKNLALIAMFGDTTKYKYYYSDLGTSIASARSGIKTFYLDFMSKVDTLSIDFQPFTTSSLDLRRGTYYLKEAKINGIDWEYDESVIPPVFIVRR